MLEELGRVPQRRAAGDVLLAGCLAPECWVEVQ